MSTALRTARLYLRPFQPTDVEALHRLWTDPGVRKYLWDDQLISVERAAEVVESSLADWSTRQYGLWVVCLLDSEEIIGFCGFRSGEAGEFPELLYGLYPSYWGKGLATEASRAALHYIFDQLGFERVWAATDPPNVASVRVLERLGMQFDRRGVLNGLDTVFYLLTQEQFRQRVNKLSSSR
jgi:RimJ/RimL family protein N-acetyltransferase